MSSQQGQQGQQPSPSSSSQQQQQQGGAQVKQEHRAAPEVVRAPLAVPMAHQGGRSAGFATMPRLLSLRTAPDLTLGGPAAAAKPAFAPLISKNRSHSRKTAGEKIDQQLPGPIPSLLQSDAKRGGNAAAGGRGGGNASGTRSGRRSNAVFVSADETGGFVPIGVRLGSHAQASKSAGNSSNLLRAAMKHDDDGDMEVDVADASGDGDATARASGATDEPDFDPWDAKEPIQLPLVDPRDPTTAKSANKKDGEEQREDLTALGMPRTVDDTMRKPPDPRHVPFHDTFGELLNDDQLFMVQLPSQLPYKPDDLDGASAAAAAGGGGSASAEAAARARKAATAASTFEKQHEFETPPFRGNLAGMEGYIGKLQVHKSGRVTLMLTNGVTFDVERGSDPKFLEELFVVSQPSQQCFRLGSVAQHVKVMPNTDSLGLTTDTEEAMLASLSLDPSTSDSLPMEAL